MLTSSFEEKFNYSLYENLSSEDRGIIDEYIPKMTAGEVNSFMKRLVEHYKTEEILEVEEDKDAVEVFEASNLSSKIDIGIFVERFISSTRSSEAINDFFINEDNFNYVVNNPQFYRGNSPAFLHIIKFFHLSRTIKTFLEDQKEVDGFIWDGIRAYFENKKTYRCGLYPYIGTFVSRQLRQNLDIGFVCPFCSTYYARDNNDKRNLISCINCKNRFTFIGVKCPNDDCGKIVPISSIDLSSFDGENIKHMRALSALSKYVDNEGMIYLSGALKINYADILDDGYKIPISQQLKKRKVKKMPEYGLDKDLASNIPELLFYLPLACPVTSGHTKAKYLGGKKCDVFGGCNTKFELRDGLRVVKNGEYSIYHTYDPRRVRYKDSKNSNYSYENYDNAASIKQQEKSNEGDVDKIPYDRIMHHMNNYFSGLKRAKNKSVLHLSSAVRMYFSEEYAKSISALKGMISEQNYLNVINLDNYLNDKNMQNNLYYNVQNNAYKVGWFPTSNAKDRIRELYIDLCKNEDSLIRKINNVVLPMRFYTYRISEIHGRPTAYRKRIGVALDKIVLPKTKRAAAGYGQNFKIDNKFISINIFNGTDNIDLTPYVKGTAYWSPENAIIHGFDNKTGIVWFNGEDVGDNKWRFPNGLVVADNSDITISAICATDAFSKMFQRFDLNGKMREIVSGLESDGLI